MHPKALFAVTILILNILSGNCLGQKSSIFNIPASIPRPCWVDKVNWNAPNIFIIDSLIKTCMQKTETDDEVEMEEPYKVAYIRWLKQNEVFIRPDGRIVINKDSAARMMRDAIEQQNRFRLSNNQRIAGAASWSVLGPVRTYNSGNLRNWQANIYSIAIAPGDNNILYCGSETGIIFKSADKGQNWTSVNDALLNSAVEGIAISPNDVNTVYCYSGGLLKTTNGGTSWTLMTGYSGGWVNRTLINPSTGRVLTASNNGIYFSDNGGTNWTKASTDIVPGVEIYDISFHPTNPSIVYAVSASSATGNPMLMYRSVNGGNSFSSVTLPASTFCSGARLAVSPANSAYVYCLTLQSDYPKLLVSSDSGITWSARTTFTGTGLVGSNVNNGMSNGQGYYDQAIMVSPSNVNHIIVGTTSAFKSTDGGYNFSAIGGYMGSFPLHPDIQAMAAAGSDAYIATDGGITFSSDFFSNTANASPRINGLSGSDNWGFGQGWSEDIVVGGRYHNGNAAVYEGYGAGNAYQIGGGEDATGHVFQIPGMSRITGFRDLGSTLKIIPATTAGTVTNAPLTNTLWPSDDYYGLFSSKLMQDPRYANVIFVGKDSALWKSENYGQSYTVLKHFGTRVWRFDIARSNPDVIYLCTRTGLQKTTNGGNTWSALAMPSGVTYSYYNTDITVNPANENEVWFCMANGTSANKVFRSTNGGSSWVNYTGSMLNGKAVAYVVAQGGTNSGVYAILNSRPAKLYYRDAAMTEWIDYSAGLPMNFNARQGGLIFYRDNKLRITGNRGTWESPLYSESAPLAMPMADKMFISCSRDTVTFLDHSILDYSGATWTWSFPGASFVSGTNSKEAKVTYPSAGKYSVTLTVTDRLGRTSSRTITDMISFVKDNCSPDTVSGKCLSLNGGGSQYNLGTANINSNNFSLSCWIKPKGNQISFSQLLAHDPYPGSSYGFGLGFTFSGYTPNLKLCYTDNTVNYGNSTSAIADSTKWNFVVLTYSPTGVKIYLNGVGYAARTATMAAIDLSQAPFYINRDIHGQGGDYKGLIDEVKIYNYALSESEIREKMHLIQSSGTEETGLLKYVQFNVIDSNNISVYELVSGKQVSLPGYQVIVNSEAPVATGTVFRKPGINSGGQHSFPGTGLDLFWPSTGTFPNGELVAFRLNGKPFRAPNSVSNSPLDRYYIINNYGANKTFTALQKIRFSQAGLLHGGYVNSDLNLFKRSSVSFDSLEWGSSLAQASLISYANGYNSQLEFPGTSITSLGQIVVNTAESATTRLNLKAFIQGYMLPGATSMTPALFNSGVPGFADNQVDSIWVEVRDGANGTLLRDPVKSILTSSGQFTAAIPAIAGSHYIALRHRNAMETWSANPVTMGQTVSYDFTTAASQAYGNNQFHLGNGVYALWSGDLNQDGVIESADYLKQETDLLSILFGYYHTDLNGDGVVESSDYILMENNLIRIIFAAKPF